MSSPFIPNKTIEKMKQLGISESELMDTFNNGEYKVLDSGAKAMIKKYNGYEVGLIYTQGKNTGEYIILTVWKRGRL